MSNSPYLGVNLDDIFFYRPYPYGSNGGVSSNSSYATKAGLEILKAGGNAIDAACAISLVLGVVEPFHSGIGGGSFFTLYHKESNEFYTCDARGVAPKNAYKGMFLDENGEVDLNLTEYSGRSVATPALYRSLGELLEKFGTMTLKEVSKPAIDLCRNGFKTDFFYARVSECPEAKHNAEAYEGFSELYLTDGKPKVFGEIIKNPELADTMEQVAENGVNWFYEGPIAEDMVKYINANKGLFDLEDLKNCSVKYRTPVKGKFKNYDIISMPPPSSGGAHIIQMLNILENFNLKELGFHSADATHIIAETMKMMFADRSVAMGDPDYVKVQLEKIISKEYGKELAQKIDMNQSKEYSPTEGIDAESYRGCTSSFSVMDKFGNAIVQTQTIRNWWGCGVVVKGRGFIMNNTMADFSPKVGVRTTQGLAYGSANAVEPGKTPLSSMCPTLVFKDGKPYLAVGCAGGPRIITSVLQMIINTLEYERMMEPAVRTPMICSLTKDQGLELEDGFSPDTIKLLENKGHRVVESTPIGEMSCMPNGIMLKDGLFYPARTNRVGGGGGALTEFNTISIDGINFVD